MIRGVGNDIIEVSRIKGVLDRYGERFLQRILVSSEIEYCMRFSEPARHVAARFAAKEAVVKALGTGISPGVSWHDITIVKNSNGRPEVQLSQRLNERFDDPTIHLSLSHTDEYASAVAIWDV